MDIITKNAQETAEVGKKVANSIVQSPSVFLLYGPLGAGKTTFVRGFINSLGISERIVSPTYIISREYKNKSKTIYHIDLYRLEGDVKKQTQEIGLMEILNEKNSTVLIEWADKLIGVFPSNATKIYFDYLGENKRKITIK